MDSEIENYFKEMIAMFENDGGASFESDDILFVDEANILTDCQAACINSFNQKRENVLTLVVNTGKSDLGEYK